ncbi:probable receptor-like protein kinase At2g39360 [Benincasa hispida]|uniref:probable receptor-like protein kinase At2g39360 n=1 Tax=Benincasa hispida TaxID=102211 RepID=UPI0019018AF4|nr:probable receptor-like protein kinase At2g39360 [Benincasa hispida]
MRASNANFLIWILCTLCLSSSLSSEFTPDDNYLFDCGSSSNNTVGDRLFLSDDSNPHGKSLSTTSKVSSSSELDLFSPLFRTAKVFESTSQYNFKIKKQGRHWIRLYFYPFVSGTFNLSLARFSVSAQNITLLKEFQINIGWVIKEYSLNVTSSNLGLTFTPMVNSFAFINALEVVSVPNELIPFTVSSVENVENSLGNRALETVARVNMGNETVSPKVDTLSRLWVADGQFLVHNDQVVVGKFVSNLTKVNMTKGSEIKAPRAVYGTATLLGADADVNSNANVSWSFNVDPGYDYLIRYHFCDIIDLPPGSMVFNVYVNSWKVKVHLDLDNLTSYIPGAPYVLDTIASPIDSSKFKISVGPTSFHDYSTAILNGLEIMKISDSRRSLDEPSFGLNSKKGSSVKVGLIAGLVAGLLLIAVLATLVIVLCRRRRSALVRHLKEEENFGLNGRESNYITGSVAFSNSKIGYRYPLAAIQEATDHFSESLAIGLGGFGKVYKGMLRDNTEVAVKRGTSKSQQGLVEFRTEIEMLSQFRHRHLVSLIGYCDEQNEMIIIYEYMEKGTLKDHLYGSELPSLSWKQRLDICIGSARGLHYLHTGSTKAIIHRDVKTANILLDQNYMAKVADFGLSKTGPEFDKTHVSTAVKGSFGYLDPEYLTTQQLTEKSDVYSFGVVMFEVLCGRPVIDPSLPREKVNLIEWVMRRKDKDQLEAIVDARIIEQIKLESLKKYVETAEKCLAECGMDRPTMGNVLWNLECALQLQGDEKSPRGKESSSQPDLSNHWEVSVSTTQFSTGSAVDIAGISMSKVFAQMVKEDMR